MTPPHLNITVIVPTRNERENIPAFLGSLPPEVALIVVDASTDDTPDIIRRLRPHNTTVICQPSNVTEARCIGAAAATTEWLLFTDADVIFDEFYFDRFAPGIAEYDAVYGPKLSHNDAYRYYYRFFSWGQQASHTLGIPAVSGSNIAMKREVYHVIGGFDLTLTVNEDSEIGWRLKRHGHRIGFNPQLKVYARDHRRLKQGRTRKTLHSLTRCALLYFNLIPADQRGNDWGYWANPHEPSKSAPPQR
jgi:glycosyltransferase involved in cell wall biosynthesis